MAPNVATANSRDGRNSGGIDPDGLPEGPAGTRPALTIALGGSGAGKTAWALERIAASPYPSLLVVPSAAQGETRAAELAHRFGADSPGRRPLVYTFRTLSSELDREYRSGATVEIGRALQRLVVADLARNQLTADSYFGPVRETRGFANGLIERIREWKLACVTPRALDASAATAAATLDDPAFGSKAKELARLFAAYDEVLATNGMHDEESVMLRSVQAVRSPRFRLPFGAMQVIFDGFYRFNQAQINLMIALATAGAREDGKDIQVAVTLPYEAERPLLFAATERTLLRLRQTFGVREITLRPAPSVGLTAVGELGQAIYRPVESEASPARSPVEAPVCVFDAPNPYVEAEMVARTFRERYDRGGYRWSDLLVVLRTLGDYTPILAAVFERYGVPLGVDGAERLSENPLVKTLLSVLLVIRNGWQREDVLSVLKSSYTAVDKIEADRLRRRARAAGIRAGRIGWLGLASGAPAEIEAALMALAESEDRLNARGITVRQMVEEVRQIVTRLGLDRHIEQGEAARQERDRAALAATCDLLDGLGNLHSLVRRSPVRRDPGGLNFAEFHAELLSALESTSSMASPGGDVVHVAEPYDTRDRPVRVAAIMGLAERVFPRRIVEDPFLRDEERSVLNRVAGLSLDLQYERTDDERYLFYLAATAPSEQLILSYPRSSADSDNLPSFFLDEVRGALSPESLQTITRTLADVAPRASEAVDLHDRLLSACADLFDPRSVGDGVVEREMAGHRLAACVEAAADSTSIRRAIGSRKRPPFPRLNDASLAAALGAAKSVFSVTELESYGRCPFQYLLSHVLTIRSETEEDDRRLRGTILHEVLRRSFRRTSRRRVPVDGSELQQEMIAELEQVLAIHSGDISPHRLQIASRLLQDAISGVVQRERTIGAQFDLVPAYFELGFGCQDGPGGRVDDEQTGSIHRGELDPASCTDPLWIDGGDGGEPVAVSGVMDRVDLDRSGRKALVLDYKLGRPPIWLDVQSGRSLQMPLYLLALERLFGKVGAVACYDSARERGRRRFHRTEHVNIRQFSPVLPLEDGSMVTPLNPDQFRDLVRTAERTAVRLARGIREAGIAPTPGDHCRTCEFGDVCRTTPAGHDGASPG